MVPTEESTPATPSVAHCEHFNFTANVQVCRLTEEDEKTVRGFTADIGITCVDCGLPFRFICSRAGSSPWEPCVSADALELRAPLEPAYVTEILGIPITSGTA